MFFRKRFARSAASTPADAVRRYLRLLTNDPDRDDDALVDALTEGGVPAGMAAAVVALVPAVAGRQVLDGLGIAFSPTFIVLDASGRKVGGGLVEGHPVTEATRSLLPAVLTSPAFQAIVLRGAEFDAVNQALNQGAAPEDLVLGPLVLRLP